MIIENLVIKAQHGDKEAFYDVICNHRGLLFGTAMQYLKNESMALEAIQEVTYRAYLKIGRLKDPKYISTWLTRIMINYCCDELNKHKRLLNLEEWGCVPQHCSQDLYEAIDLKCCVEKLSPKYRDVIIMRYYEDLSVEDIACALNKPVGTVKTWISRGLAQMRVVLKGGNLNVSNQSS